jgi:integrase
MLVEWKAESDRGGSDLVFGRTPSAPFTPSAVRTRAARAWASANVERKERGVESLNPIGLHEARHTYASLMIEAGVHAKA